MRWAAAFALASAQACAQDAPQERVTAYVKGLKSHSAAARHDAVEALGRLGAAAVPAVVGALRDRDPAVRFSACRALGNMGASAEPAIPALIAALKDSDPGVRQDASIALGQIGVPAVPALAAALKDADADERTGACLALLRIGPAAAGAVPALGMDIEDTGHSIFERIDACNALGHIGSPAGVPALLILMQPDLGTASILVLIFLTIAAVTRVR